MIVQKNFLSPEELFFVRKILQNSAWGFGYTSTDPNKPIWNFDKQQGKPIAELLASKLDYTLDDWHINGQTFKLDGSPHKDSYDRCNVAAVFFPYEWKADWGGLLHIEENYIVPESNTIVIFDANKTHWAEAPVVPVLRVSIGLKLFKE